MIPPAFIPECPALDTELLGGLHPRSLALGTLIGLLAGLLLGLLGHSAREGDLKRILSS